MPILRTKKKVVVVGLRRQKGCLPHVAAAKSSHPHWAGRAASWCVNWHGPAVVSAVAAAVLAACGTLFSHPDDSRPGAPIKRTKAVRQTPGQQWAPVDAFYPLVPGHGGEGAGAGVAGTLNPSICKPVLEKWACLLLERRKCHGF